MNEHVIPILPCQNVDDVVPFYEALGFTLTFRQARPNPYVCFNRGGIDLHFFGLEAFAPENSMGSAILLVPDTGVLYDEFAAGLRAAFGKLPISGIPRITRPRRKQGTAAGFTVVDPGGNWLRIYALGATEEDGRGSESRLERVLMNATRQGDARGDDAIAISVLEAGLSRHADAPDVEKLPLLVYLAELQLRIGNLEFAAQALDSVDSLALNPVEREGLAAELANAAELRASL